MKERRAIFEVIGVLERIHDKRISRTKRLIRDALTELMEEKGFEGVSVRNLTEKAKINRGTFYLHYHDKYDLLEQSIEEILQGVEKVVKDVNPIEALSYISKDEPYPIIIELFEFFKENHRFIKVLLGANGEASFQAKLKDLMRGKFFYLLSEIVKNTEGMKVPIEFFLSYVSSAHLGIIQQWLEGGMKESPSEITLITTRLTLLGPGNAAGLKNE